MNAPASLKTDRRVIALVTRLDLLDRRIGGA